MIQLCWKVNTEDISAEGQIALKKNNWEKVIMIRRIKVCLNMCSILNNKCVSPTFVKGVGFIVSVKDVFAIDKMVQNSLKSFQRLIMNASLNPLEYTSYQYT